jgi:hypothetical protein
MHGEKIKNNGHSSLSVIIIHVKGLNCPIEDKNWKKGK